ncbi:MAG: hypothetical protein JNL38_26055 [Myxococcales bacterium]|jgi:hypothetical protein|nr:hypothetical protein [Myxococcales bacterium]
MKEIVVRGVRGVSCLLALSAAVAVASGCRSADASPGGATRDPVAEVKPPAAPATAAAPTAKELAPAATEAAPAPDVKVAAKGASDEAPAPAKAAAKEASPAKVSAKSAPTVYAKPSPPAGTVFSKSAGTPSSL